MTMVQRKEFEKVLKKFNDEEMGGGYLYFLHGKELVQLDMCDYSTITVCGIEDIEEFTLEEEGLYLKLFEGIYEEIDSCWINENGCQF